MIPMRTRQKSRSLSSATHSRNASIPTRMENGISARRTPCAARNESNSALTTKGSSAEIVATTTAKTMTLTSPERCPAK